MSANPADAQDIDQVTPRRYMQRQWKKNKPHLAPSDSLPTLRLCPNRPLFVCARCGFANAWIPLCLWCEWTSKEATRQFEANLPRPRRLSAPPRAVPAAVKKDKQRPRRATSADSSTPAWSGSTSTHRPARGVPGITTVLEAFQRDVCHDDGRGQVDPRNGGCASLELPAAPTSSLNVPKEMVDSGGVHRVRTATSITPPPFPTCSFPNVAVEGGGKRHSEDHQELKRDSRLGRHWRRLPALCIRASRCSTAAVEPENTRIAAQATNSASSVLMDASRDTPRSTGSLDMSDGGRIRSIQSVSSSSQCSPKRGLRRTKNMTLVKRGSALSYRSRSPYRESVDIYPTSAVEARQSHVLSLASSQDHDAPPVRLGHPSRPYYSAIRKDMSRPTSPVFSLAARTPSPISSHADYVPRGTKSLDCGDRSGVPYAPELRPMSMVLPGQATPPKLGSGFSLSGEMELRMNLARWRRENALDEPSGFHFQEMRPSRARVVNVKGRVKQLGRGLKELVLGKS